MDIGIIRDPSHTFGMTKNQNTSIVIPTERSDEESPKCTEKRDPSHTFGMTNMLDYVISNEREKSLKNIANVSTANKRSLTYVRDDWKLHQNQQQKIP